MANKIAITDVFVNGARKGLNVGLNSMTPNVVMAFVFIQILDFSGLLKILGTVCGPVMALFGLPGQAVTVLFTAWLSMTGGVGVAAGLLANGAITPAQATIVLPAIFLMGAQVQYLGRCLGTAGVKGRYYPLLIGTSIFNAAGAMLIMRILVRA